MAKKYYANMSVNNGTRYRQDIEGTNYRKLAADISSIARANCFINNEYSWWVWDNKGIIVAAGSGRATYNGYDYYSCKYLIGTNIYGK